MTPHPTKDELSSFLFGKMPIEQSDSVGGHLEACSPCQATVHNLEQMGDTLLDILRRPVQPIPVDAECQRAMEQAASLIASKIPTEDSITSHALEPDGSGDSGAVVSVSAINTRSETPVQTEGAKPTEAIAAEKSVPLTTDQFIANLRAVAVLSSGDFASIERERASYTDGAASPRHWFSEVC